MNIALPSAQRALGFPGRSERPRLSTTAFTAVIACLTVQHTGPLAPSIAAPRGYTLAFALSAGVLRLGAILAVVLLPSWHRLAELRNAAGAVAAPASA